jgi:hypothetical protein
MGVIEIKRMCQRAVDKGRVGRWSRSTSPDDRGLRRTAHFVNNPEDDFTRLLSDGCKSVTQRVKNTDLCVVRELVPKSFGASLDGKATERSRQSFRHRR